MNKFVQRSWEQEDDKRGYTVYHGTKPSYKGYKQDPVALEFVCLIAMLVTIWFLLML